MTKVYPVVHYWSDHQAITQAALAKSLGADGVFFISHIGFNERLPSLGASFKKSFPDFEVGINLLGESPLEAAKLAASHGLDMVWGDNCGVSSYGASQDGCELAAWAKENNNINVFASVAFKYQTKENEPPLAAKNALDLGFMPTTSGAGTGKAPSVDKIASMSKAVEGRLAIASGMDCDNVREFKPFLSHILVATGVSLDDYYFAPEKLKRFIDLVKV